MNKLERIAAILRGVQACEIMGADYYPATAGRIARQANLPRVSVYRAMSRLVALGLVDYRRYSTHTGSLIEHFIVYHLTIKGQEFLDNQKELPL